MAVGCFIPFVIIVIMAFRPENITVRLGEKQRMLRQSKVREEFHPQKTLIKIFCSRNRFMAETFHFKFF